MNVEYVEELLKKNKIGKIIKLMNDNIYNWSASDYEKIFRINKDKINHIHLSLYFWYVHNTNIIYMKVLDNISNFKKIYLEYDCDYEYICNNKIISLDSSTLILSALLRIIYCKMFSENLNCFIHILHEKPSIIRRFFNMYNADYNDVYGINKNHITEEHEFLEFYYPGIMELHMNK